MGPIRADSPTSPGTPKNNVSKVGTPFSQMACILITFFDTCWGKPSLTAFRFIVICHYAPWTSSKRPVSVQESDDEEKPCIGASVVPAWQRTPKHADLSLMRHRTVYTAETNLTDAR